MTKLSFPRSGFQIFLLAMVFLGIRFGWAQQVEKQPSAEATAGKSLKNVPRPNLSSSDLRPKVVEDYSTPAITVGTVLGGIEALELENDQDPELTQEVVRVMWRAGDPIDLYVIKPTGVKKPPVILYLYDYPTETDAYHRREFCRLLTKGGFAAVGFVPALTGQRYHDRPMKEWFVSELRESLSTSAHDVQMILNYLTSRGDLDMNRVGMFGDGSGASIAILAAAADPRIRTLDLLDPWGDWPDWAKESKRIPENERPNYLTPQWQAAVAPMDPVKWLPELKMTKVRIQFVQDIAITPADVQRKIEAAAPANAKIVHFENAAAFSASIAGGTGFDWIKKSIPFSVVPGSSAAGRTQERGPSTRSQAAPQ